MMNILLRLGDNESIEADDAPPVNEICLDVALTLAREYDGRILGLYTIPLLVYPAYDVVPATASFIQEFYEMARSRAVETGTWFTNRCDQEGIPSECRIEDGAVLSPLIRASRAADIVIVPQAPQTALPNPGISADEVVLTAACPVLAVPRADHFDPIGRRILVAWNDSRESSRAVRDALPLLKDADGVTLLMVNPDTDTEGEIPGADIADALARHDVRVEIQRRTAERGDIAGAILAAAAEAHADLLVMGAWGHSRLREFILGGATRGVLRAMTRPVLMSH